MQKYDNHHKDFDLRLIFDVLKKAEAAAAKAAVANAQLAAEEDDKWSKGAKSNAKK
jgi:hypothetical protein